MMESQLLLLLERLLLPRVTRRPCKSAPALTPRRPCKSTPALIRRPASNFNPRRALVLLLLLLTHHAAATKYCGGDTPLSTPYFAPYYETEQMARGCLASTHVNDAQVHVIRVQRPEPDIFLNIKGFDDKRLHFVLDTPVPVTWHLHASSSSLTSSPSFLLSYGSSVVSPSGSPLPASFAILGSEAVTVKLAMAKFSNITSFTQIETANKIYISLPQAAASATCDLSTRQRSPLAAAFSSQQQPIHGCYHAEAAGVLPNDVHVIDLTSATRLQPPLRTVRSAEEDFGVPSVYLDLVPDRPADGRQPLPRNLTLILKSHEPVKWMLQSHGITGQLVIIAGSNPVENYSITPDQQLEIEKTEIPDSFDAIMTAVTTQYGLPVSYMRVQTANLLSLKIPPRSKRELSTFLERDRSNLMREESSRTAIADNPPSPHSDEKDNILEEIEEEMTKYCSVKEVKVIVPMLLLDRLGVEKVTLNDPSCVGRSNGSHMVLASHSTACGSTALTYGSAPMYRNHLVLTFANGDLQGTEAKIPFICKFKPGIPHKMPGVDPPDDEYYVDEDKPEDPINPDWDSQDEMYQLTVQLRDKQDHSSPLLLRRSDSAPVARDDELYVTSSIDAVPYLSLAMEQCWLSNTSRVTSHPTAQDMQLLKAGCPHRAHVTMHRVPGSANTAFSFKMTSSLVAMHQVWLQCRMGLCSSTSIGAQGNIRLCPDAVSTCSDPLHVHQASSVQQVTVRGPLHIIPVTRDTLGMPQPGLQVYPGQGNTGEDVEGGEDGEEGEERDKAHSPHSTLVGVTVEVAVAIALTSFLVGAASTGALWVVHNRTTRDKAIRVRTGEFAVDGSELQSMITGPMTPANGHCHNQNTSMPESNGDLNGNCSGHCVGVQPRRGTSTTIHHSA